ncbi:MAG: amidohydrolase family protein [Victivallales bacterium]|nr:amidohydrolase family protein [Victivallales bacterium]
MEHKYEIPLLYDRHNHVGFYAALTNCLDVRHDKDYDNVIKTIKKLPNKMNLVMGWTFLDYNNEDIESLPPVLICDQMLHSFIINKKGKEILIKENAAFVENVDNSEWIEKKLPSILTLIPRIQGITEQDMVEFFYKLEENGIYSTDDMLAIDNEYVALVKNGKFANRCRLWADHETYNNLSPENKKKIAGIKIFLDGALGPETAATRGYVSGKNGLLLYSDDELQQVLTFISNERLPVAIHSVGERGIEQLLNILESSSLPIPYIRVEHAMFITEDIARRCKKANIILSMQPNFSFDSLLFKGKLTDEHLEQNNPFRMLIDKVGYAPGEDMFFSSDGMPYGVKAALESSLFPPFSGQILTLDEMVKGYCIEDKSKGTIQFNIENNKFCDLMVQISIG